MLTFPLQNGVDCWVLDDIWVRQTKDGFVRVWRGSKEGGARTFLSASPVNGKLKVETGFIQVSLSLRLFA